MTDDIIVSMKESRQDSHPKIRMTTRDATPTERRSGRDLAFLMTNLNNWREELGDNMWVGVYEEERISEAENLQDLFSQAEVKGLRALMVFAHTSEQVLS